MKDYSTMDDKELVSLSRGDGAAMGEIISRYTRTVLSLAKKFASSADYEELVSDGMQALLSAVEGYEPKLGEFSAYVSVCAVNRMRNTVKRAVRRSSEISDEDDELLETLPDPKPTPEELLIESEEMDSLMRTLDTQLTLLERNCIEAAVMGLSYDETAERLGVTKKSVDNALSRARAKLRKYFS